MRTFIILGFLAAVASAGTGYNYGVGQTGSSNLVGQGSNSYTSTSSLGSGSSSGGSSGGLFGSSSNLVGSGLSSGGYSSGGSSGLIGGGGYSSGGSSGLISGGGYSSGGSSGLIGGGGYSSGGSSGLIGGGGYSSGGSGYSSGGSGYSSGGSSGGATLNIGLDALNSVPQTVEYSKQYYHFTAPEEAHEEGQVQKQLSNVLKKNLQVVFIKAPENNAATNAALQLAKQAIEQRTAIYVLTKQNDGSQLVGQLQQIQENVQIKPEVKFVKYRTAQDVQRAKQEIQSQYDNFGGAAENFDGGVAQVLNYASPAAANNVVIGGGSGYSSGSSQLIGGGSGYSSGSGSGSILGGGSSFGSGSSLGGGSSYSSGSSLGGGSSYGSGSGSLIGGGGSSYSSGSGSGSGSTIISGLGSSVNYLPPSKK